MAQLLCHLLYITIQYESKFNNNNKLVSCEGCRLLCTVIEGINLVTKVKVRLTYETFSNSKHKNNKFEHKVS
jgi:hypothetical protein